MSIDTIAVLVLVILVLLFGSSIVQLLQKIRDILSSDYKVAIEKALREQIAVIPPVREKEVLCECGHNVTEHSTIVTGKTMTFEHFKPKDSWCRQCGKEVCSMWRPKGKPWLADPPRI